MEEKRAISFQAGGVGLQCLAIADALGCAPPTALVGSEAKAAFVRARHPRARVLVRGRSARGHSSATLQSLTARWARARACWVGLARRCAARSRQGQLRSGAVSRQEQADV